MRSSPSTWTDNEAGRGSGLGWREAWAARELVVFFAVRDLRVRYKQALFGVTWVVVQPLITVIVFTLVINRLADIDTGGKPYPLFALAGLLAWSYIAQVIGRGSDVLVGNSSLITKVYFPRIIAPIASLLPGLVDLGVGLVLFGVLSAFYGEAPGAGLLLLPLWLLLLALSTVGPVCLLAALNVRFRDVRQVTGPLLQALLFVSPVAYGSSSVSGTYRWAYGLNPFAGVIEIGRWVLLGADLPFDVVLVSTASSIVLAVAGLLYFQREAPVFADHI